MASAPRSSRDRRDFRGSITANLPERETGRKRRLALRNPRSVGLRTLQELHKLPQFRGPRALIFAMMQFRAKARFSQLEFGAPLLSCDQRPLDQGRCLRVEVASGVVVACQIRQSLRLLLAAAGVESLIRREPIIFPFDMRDIMRATVHALPILVVALWGAARPGSAQSMAGGQSSVSAMPGFGGAVAVSDGEVFVGEAGNVIVSGAVYVFHRRSGGWEEVARLRASDGVAGDGFGTAIAVDGATLLVSAAARDDGGAVYVFERSMSGDWMEVDRLSALEGDARGGYGATLALVDDIAMVGAPAMATTGAGRAESPVAGAVYVFERSGGSWSARAVLSEGDEGNGFGAAMALRPGRLLVGAPQADGAGVAYSFSRDDGVWRLDGAVRLRGARGDDLFGASLSLDGEEALVAAPGRNEGEGAVFAFQRDRDSGEWVPAGRLTPFDGFQSDEFGSSLGLGVGEVWIGSPRAGGRRGAAYVFSGGISGGWGSATKIMDSAFSSGDGFAATLDVDEDLAVLGVSGADYGVGSAVIFERGAAGWAPAGTVRGEMEAYAAVLGEQVDCAEDSAAAFECAGYDLVSFLPVGDMGVPRGVNLNDIWGWTDPDTGREYALAARRDGVSFVDVSDPLNPRYLGQLLKTEGSPLAAWRDIKVYKNHAYIVADGSGLHGIQIFDLTQLRDVTEPVTFEETAHYDGVASVHNIAINEETGFGYSVGNSSGGETCGGGIHIIDLEEPASPTFAGCFSQPGTGRNGTGYTHDAQCVTYRGPDEEHQGKQICLGSNETAFSIADVTDPSNTVALSLASYPNVAYTHQGWLTEDQRYFYQGDELDEGEGRKTRTLIWDVSDLDDPQLVKEFYGTHESTDHNMYVLGNLM